MTQEEKNWIDNASYEDMLRKWRHTPLGDDYFQSGEKADYFIKKMAEKKAACNDPVRASKNVGW